MNIKQDLARLRLNEIYFHIKLVTYIYVYLSYAKKVTGSQLSLQHGTRTVT